MADLGEGPRKPYSPLRLSGPIFLDLMVGVKKVEKNGVGRVITLQWGEFLGIDKGGVMMGEDGVGSSKEGEMEHEGEGGELVYA